VRQPAVSQVTRTQLQQNLIRSMIDKIAQKRSVGHLAGVYRILHALAAALSVDSNFTDAQLEALVPRLALHGGRRTFITAPTTAGTGTSPVRLNRTVTRRLWRAIRTDAVGAFARRYPWTVTPGAPG
jgi:hypothetical protein